MEYLVGLLVIGTAALGMAWMPTLSKYLRISYAVIYVLFGVILFWALPFLPDINPVKHPLASTRLTEIVLIVALMGSGLKIDQRFKLRKWRNPFRLITIGLLLCIAFTAFLAWYFFEFDPAVAILLGAVLSPTDPVLASDVQVGPPHEGEKENVQFTLTAEGGMNDGIAFPFVWLGILLSGWLLGEDSEWLSWGSFYLLYKLTAGIVCGYLLGKLFAYILFSLPEKYRAAKIEDGFVALTITLVVYALTELLQGYGFIAVFTCAVALRNSEMGHQLHRTLHSFSDQIERILVAIVLLLFGGSLIDGILHPLNWPLVLFAILFIVIIRPVSAWLSLIGVKMPGRERAAICFFGIRGVGSLYYMSFVTKEMEHEKLGEMWSFVSLIILLSIVVHGVTAPTAIQKLEAKRKDASG